MHAMHMYLNIMLKLTLCKKSLDVESGLGEVVPLDTLVHWRKDDLVNPNCQKQV